MLDLFEFNVFACAVEICTILVVPINATVNSQKVLIGESVEERCNDGFLFEDSNNDTFSITCLGNNIWTNQLKPCKREF